MSHLAMEGTCPVVLFASVHLKLTFSDSETMSRQCVQMVVISLPPTIKAGSPGVSLYPDCQVEAGRSDICNSLNIAGK